MFDLASLPPAHIHYSSSRLTVSEVTRWTCALVKALCSEQGMELQILPNLAGHVTLCLMDHAWFPNPVAHVSIVSPVMDRSLLMLDIVW